MSDGGDRNTSNRQFGLLSDQKGTTPGATGFAYQYTNVGVRSSVIWTDADLSQSAVQEFSAYVGHGNNDGQMRFLVRIGDAVDNNWYVSTAAGMATVGGVANFTLANATLFSLPFSTAAADWAALAYDGLVGTASTGFAATDSFTALEDPLPVGNITAVGAYLYGTNNSATRLDDFTVIPEPATYAAFIGLLALGLVVWRRRR